MYESRILSVCNRVCVCVCLCVCVCVYVCVCVCVCAHSLCLQWLYTNISLCTHAHQHTTPHQHFTMHTLPNRHTFSEFLRWRKHTHSASSTLAHAHQHDKFREGVYLYSLSLTLSPLPNSPRTYRTATHRKTKQHIATHYNTLQLKHNATSPQRHYKSAGLALQHTTTCTATHYNMHCNTLQHALQHTTTHTITHTATTASQVLTKQTDPISPTPSC